MDEHTFWHPDLTIYNLNEIIREKLQKNKYSSFLEILPDDLPNFK
jgi:hypothetical protein